MTGFSLRQAATAASISKATVARAIQTGRLSAERLDNGGWSIQPVELFRVFTPKPAPDSPGDGQPGQGGPSRDALETEIRMLKDRLSEMRQELARAHETAMKALERPILLPGPDPAQRPWWRRLAG